MYNITPDITETIVKNQIGIITYARLKELECIFFVFSFSDT
jgi:hypothetical protein